MKWNRVTTPKNIERMKEFKLPLRWYIDELKTSEMFRDEELLWQLKKYIPREKVVLVRRYETPVNVAMATENWDNAVVISGRKYIAKIREYEKVTKVAITRL